MRARIDAASRRKHSQVRGLETLPVEELAYGRLREHATGCHECNRVTRVVAEREHNMRMAFGELRSSVPAAQTAASVRRTSRRRKVARYTDIGFAVATVATVLFVMWSRLVPTPPQVRRFARAFGCGASRPSRPPRSSVHTSRRQAAFLPTELAARHHQCRGVAEEMATAQSVLDRYDTPTEWRCAVQVTVPKVP